MDEKIINAICDRQACLFQIFAQEFELNSFIVAFANTNFCKEALDTKYSYFQMQDELVWKEMVERELPTLPKPKVNISKAEIRWIGYAYRLMQIKTGLKTYELLEKYPLEHVQKQFYKDEYVGRIENSVNEILEVSNM